MAPSDNNVLVAGAIDGVFGPSMAEGIGPESRLQTMPS